MPTMSSGTPKLMLSPKSEANYSSPGVMTPSGVSRPRLRTWVAKPGTEVRAIQVRLLPRPEADPALPGLVKEVVMCRVTLELTHSKFDQNCPHNHCIYTALTCTLMTSSQIYYTSALCSAGIQTHSHPNTQPSP